MKNLLFVILLVTCSLLSNAQYYLDFMESKSFYDKAVFVKSKGITKEVIIVKQLKNKILEDSFKIVVINYNSSGSIISTYSGSKWSTPTIRDTFEYNTLGQQKKIIYTDKAFGNNAANKDMANSRRWPEESDTIKTGSSKYIYDPVNKVKKVFHYQTGLGERLLQLVFYDENNRVKKIDFLPENERVNFAEYVYKKNKLKIYSVTQKGRICNDRMEFDENSKVVKREVDFMQLGGWTTNKYYYTYTTNNLIETERKVQDGILYTLVTHYYY